MLQWGHGHLRDLPWRQTRDPWAVLVSEVMAQQTQVERVVPKWRAFLERWPDPAACASARLGEVLELWSGLGYPRRARDLHTSAGRIVAEHDGRVPGDLDALLELPGIGPYTARAVLAFAFERDVAVVDTNIARLLARRVGRALTRREVWAAAESLLPDGQGWWWNQTLMELGASVCRPRKPVCGACPVGPTCSWLASGRSEPDPAAGSALVSGGQSVFVGSDRQARGRLIAAATRKPVAAGDVASAAGLPDDVDRAARLADALVAEGLIVRDMAGQLTLP